MLQDTLWSSLGVSEHQDNPGSLPYAVFVDVTFLTSLCQHLTVADKPHRGFTHFTDHFTDPPVLFLHCRQAPL